MRTSIETSPSEGSASRPDGPVPESGRARRIRRLLRYTGVNLVSLLIDYGIFLLIISSLGVPVTASAVSFAVAFAVNYRLSRRFVFGTDGAHKGETRLFAEFMATGLLGIVLTAVVTAAGIHGAGASPVVSKTAAMLICFVTLYLIRSRMVFTRLE